MEWNLTWGTPLRYFLEEYFENCGQKNIPYNSNFVHVLQDTFFSTILDIGEFE